MRSSHIAKAGVGAVWELCALPGPRPVADAVAVGRYVRSCALRVLSVDPDAAFGDMRWIIAFAVGACLERWLGGGAPADVGREISEGFVEALRECPGRDQIGDAVALAIRTLIAIGGEK